MSDNKQVSSLDEAGNVLELGISAIVSNIVNGYTHPFTAKIDLLKLFKEWQSQQVPKSELPDSLDEDFKKFKEWWSEQTILGIINPVVVFGHFLRYFKPQWQSQQKEEASIDYGVESKVISGITYHFPTSSPFIENVKEPSQKETKPTGLRWVKASEELPTKTVYGKVKGLLNNEEIKDAFIIPMPDGYFTFQGVGFFYTKQADYIIEWLSEEETKPVEDKTEKKYSYKITEHESYIVAYKVNTFEERTIAICDNAEKADFICKALNLCSNYPELLETPKPVSEEGDKKKTTVGPVNQIGRCKTCGHSPCMCNRPMDI